MRGSGVDRVSRGAGEGGFTLIELLIAMTIFGLLVVIMFGGLRFGTSAWSKSEARATETNEIVAVENLLRREISTAYPDFLTLQQGGPYVNFDGEPSRIGFRGDLPQQIGFSEIAWIEFTTTTRDGADQLVMSWRLVRAKGGQGFPAEKPTEVPVLAGIEGLGFAYFGSDQPNQPGYWHDNWQQRMTLPDLVKVRVTFEPSLHRYWPELVIATELNADSRCLYDPVSRKCRGRS